MNQFNNYIPFMLSQALDNWKAVKEELNKVDMRKILDFVLTKSYRNKLRTQEWNIYVENYYQTVDKLKNLGPKIKAEAAKAKSNSKLADKVYGNNKHTKWGHDNNSKVAEADIDDMVNGLDIAIASKTKLKQILNKFPTLFGRGLGPLEMEPVDIKIQPGSKPYTGRYYNIPKAYK